MAWHGLGWPGVVFGGGLTDNSPIPFTGLQSSLVLTVDRWRDHESDGFPLVRADWEYADLKFQQGYEDAQQHHHELEEALASHTRSCRSDVGSDDTTSAADQNLGPLTLRVSRALLTKATSVLRQVTR